MSDHDTEHAAFLAEDGHCGKCRHDAAFALLDAAIDALHAHDEHCIYCQTFGPPLPNRSR